MKPLTRIRHGLPLKDGILDKLNEIVDYLCATRLIQGPGIRLSETVNGLVISVTAARQSLRQGMAAAEYDGPFAVRSVAVDAETNAASVSIAAGTIVVGPMRYPVPASPAANADPVSLPSGYTLWLVGTYNNGQPTFSYSAATSAPNTSSGQFAAQIATYDGTTIRQVQFGEISTIPWGLSSGGSDSGGSGGSTYVPWYPDWSNFGHTAEIVPSDYASNSAQAYVAPANGWVYAFATFKPSLDNLQYRHYRAHLIINGGWVKVAELMLFGQAYIISDGVMFLRDAEDDEGDYCAWETSDGETTIYTYSQEVNVGSDTFNRVAEDDDVDFVDRAKPITQTSVPSLMVGLGGGLPIPVRQGASIYFYVQADSHAYLDTTPGGSRRYNCGCVFYAETSSGNSGSGSSGSGSSGSGSSGSGSSGSGGSGDSGSGSSGSGDSGSSDPGSLGPDLTWEEID